MARGGSPLMAAVRLRARVELRNRWRAWLGLALLIGLLGGLVTGLAAGARRTETAYQRLQEQSAPADLLVLDTTLLTPELGIDLDEAAHLEGVVDSVLVHALLAVGGSADGRALPPFAVASFSTSDRALGRTVERRLLLEGRFPNPEAPDEILVSYEAARRYNLGPGSIFELDLIESDRLVEAFTPLLVTLTDRVSGRDTSEVDLVEAGNARRYRFVVTGIETSAMDFPPVPGTLVPMVFPTPAFHERTGRHIGASPILLVRLDPDVSVPEYKADLERHNPGRPVVYSGGVDDRAVTVQRSIDLQAKGLWFLALLVALAAMMIVAQLLVRQVALESDEQPALRALGMTPAQLLAVGAVRAAVVAGAAGLLVIVVAGAVSPLFPLGTAAAAEPAPGFRADPSALVIGAVVVAVLTFALSVIATRARITSQMRARSPQIDGVARRDRWFRHLPLTLRLGGRLALDPGRGRTAVPVRSTLASLSIAVGAAALALTVTASLDHLTDTPRLYGWVWDAQIGGVGSPDISEPLTAGLLDNPAVDNVGVGGIPQLEINGIRVDGYAVDDVQGSISAAVLDGRAPETAGEIALGTATLDDVGASVGDRVEVSTGDRAVRMRVVGRSVFPNLGDAGQLGRGARLTFAGLERVAPGSERTMVLVDFDDDASVSTEVANLRRALDVYPVYDDLRPTDLLNFGQGGTLTPAIAVVLSVVVAATLIHVLVTATRRRRRDLAIVKTLGLSRRQISATVAWQATVLCAAALLIGVPLGVAAGRAAWTLVAGQAGFPSVPVTPGAALLALMAAVLVFANLVALGPAWFARRTPPARILRSE